MILTNVFFHLSALFTLQLIALIGALFLLIYIGKQELNKWFSLVAAAVIGLILLTMAATFLGAICMHERGERHERQERNWEREGDCGPAMGMGMHGQERRIIRIEGDAHSNMGMPGCPNMGECQNMESCGNTAGCDMPCCKDKDGHCDMDGKKMIIRKDTLVKKKK
jgi:hypothetical protein